MYIHIHEYSYQYRVHTNIIIIHTEGFSHWVSLSSHTPPDQRTPRTKYPTHMNPPYVFCTLSDSLSRSRSFISAKLSNQWLH